MKKHRQKYFPISIPKLEWWHGDAWPIILAFRGNHPVYRTERHSAGGDASRDIVHTERMSTETRNGPGDETDKGVEFQHLKTGS